MDARQLTYFLGIVDHGSFSRAAEHLLIAQPSLSQAMKNLERELGVTLFRRVGRGVVLSEPGRQLVGPARHVLRSLRAAEDAVTSTRELRTGTVDLIAMPSPAVEPLTSLVGTFRAAHPGLTVRVRAAFTAEETIEATRSGAVEIGLLGAQRLPRVPDLQLLPLQPQPLVLIGPPHAAGAPAGTPVSRTDLGGYDYVISQRDSLMRRFVDEALATDPKDSPQTQRGRVVAEVEHRTSLLPLVVAGLGHTVMPDSWRGLAEGLGCSVRTIEPVVRLEVAMVYRRDGLSPAAEAFIRSATAQSAGD